MNRDEIIALCDCIDEMTFEEKVKAIQDLASEDQTSEAVKISLAHLFASVHYENVRNRK